MTQALDYHFFRLPSELWRDAIALRFEVFVHEQGVPRELEIDACDDIAQHLLALDADGSRVGTLRIVIRGEEAKIGRVAVAAAHRYRGTGTQMMRLALDYCRAADVADVVLDAQTYIVPFYRSLGFVAEGEPFLDAGIPHLRMRLAR